jgi:hypothetical protein
MFRPTTRAPARLGGVLPLKTTGEREARTLRHARNLVRSLDHFWTGSQPFQLAVVTPGDETVHVAAELPSTDRVAIRVIPEQHILTNAARYPGLHGWFRQMAIKIGYARIAETPWYMTFDGDVICCRPFDEDTFWRNGRMITEWEPVSWHPEWWYNTSAVLGMSPPPPIDVLGVTPNIFSREIALSCVRQLGQVSDLPWDVHFAAGCALENRQVSDLALYTLAGMRTGRLMDLHWGREVPPDWPTLHAHIHLWTREQWDFDKFAPVGWIDHNPNGHFVVVQSTIGYDPADIMAKFEGLFQRPRPPRTAQQDGGRTGISGWFGR